MDALSHYRQAEQIFTDRRDLAEVYGSYAAVAAMMQAHATLALVGVTAINGGTNQFLEDHHAWSNVASVTAPIAAETDDEEDFDVAGVIHDLGDDDRCADNCTGCDVEPSPTAHLDDDTIRVGSISPTDPDELGPWLLALPHRAVLLGADGYPYQRSTGYETIHRAPDREFPALVALGGAPLELTEGANDVLGLAETATPFTVLALGTKNRE